jgi:hypothetical protein
VTGEPGGGDVREGARGERERFWGEGRLTGRAHRGEGGDGSNRRAQGARGGGGRLGRRGRLGRAEAWLGRVPGWAARLTGPRAWPGRKDWGRGEKGKRFFSLF